MCRAQGLGLGSLEYGIKTFRIYIWFPLFWETTISRKMQQYGICSVTYRDL